MREKKERIEEKETQEKIDNIKNYEKNIQRDIGAAAFEPNVQEKVHLFNKAHPYLQSILPITNSNSSLSCTS